MHPNYELARELIQQVNEKGYNREITDYACEYWWSTKQYLEPEFAQLLAPDSWVDYLHDIVILDEEGRAENLKTYLHNSKQVL